MNGDSHIDFAPSTSTSLIRRVKSGDQEAWERFVRLCSGVIYSKCRTHELSPEDSANVLQEVFQRVLEAIGNFRKGGPVFHVAEELQMTAKSVRQAKYMVLKRVRQELAEQ